MTISAMKQALEALEGNCTNPVADPEQAKKEDEAITALRQAIAEAEKQEPAFYVIPATDRFGEGYEQTFWEDPAGFPVYTRPVYASDISQEPVDKTAKDRHEHEDDLYDVWVEQGTSQENRQVAKNATTWVGLTDEERGMVVNANFGIGVWEMARAIEAKLKEKNT
jgi:hypothetical protein